MVVIDYLKEKNIVNIFYFDLEREETLDLCNRGDREIVRYIKARIPQETEEQRIFLFIDEVQYLDNPSGLLKVFYDHHREQFKLFVSGSSSFAIKSKFKDSLVGRTIDLEIFGLNFKEFLDFKGLTYNLAAESEAIHQELKSLYQEYILYGTYPQVVLAPNIELKELYLKGIIEKYIYKDIRDLANIREIRKFNNLLKMLASQTGQLVNINELSSTLNIARPTIEDYLYILENTYIIKLLFPYHSNIRSELTKMPKVYFEDTGILNILRNKKLDDTFDGSFFENAVYAYLRRKFAVQDIYFWRTKLKQEVDFVIEAEDLIPLEAKISYNDKVMKNLLYFKEKYEIDTIYAVTCSKKDKSKYSAIHQIYPWEIEKLKG